VLKGTSVSLSASGQYQVLVGNDDGAGGGYIHMSSDYGITWIQNTNAGLRKWYGVSISDTAQYETAVVNGGYIYTSGVDLVGNTQLTSTVTGLGSSGYLSTLITRTAFNQSALITLTNGAIQYRFFDATATAQIRGNSATPTVAFSGYASIFGQSPIMYVNTGTTLNATTWTTVEATGMSNIGDTNIFTLQDFTNSKMYRCTFAVGGSSGTSATIYIETLI
jgi:hypothetical protein